MAESWYSTRKVSVWVLIPVLLVSFYVSAVPSIELFSDIDLVRSVKLYRGGSVTAKSFKIGDVAVFRVDSDFANAYSLTVSNGTCDVFVGSGGLSGLKKEILVPLYPPAFRGKSDYVFCLRAYAYNFPVLGSTLSDVEVGDFSVEGTKTRLSLNATYNQASYTLSMQSQLVNDDSEPLVNQTVSFYLQPNGNGSSLSDLGWIYLGSGRTGADGRASFGLGCNIGGGVHKVQVRFDGSGDFGKSKADALFTIGRPVPTVNLVGVGSLADGARVTFQVVGDAGFPLAGRLVTLESMTVDLPPVSIITDENGLASIGLDGIGRLTSVQLRIRVHEDAFTSGFETTANVDTTNVMVAKARASPSCSSSLVRSESVREIELKTNESRLYALMPIGFSAGLNFDQNMGGLNFSYYFDGWERISTNVTQGQPIELDGELFWAYAFGTSWTPRESYHLGSHAIVVRVFDASGGLLAEGNRTCLIERCPTNLRMNYPSGFVGKLAVTASFSLPRLYADVSNEFVSSRRLVPGFVYDCCDQCVDDVTLRMPVSMEMYVNGSKVLGGNYSGAGLWTAFASVGSSLHTVLNVTVVNKQGIYFGNVLKKTVNLTRVTINDSPSTTNNNFTFGYSVNPLDENDRSFLDINSNFTVNVDLFQSALRNATVSFMLAKRISRLAKWGYVNLTKHPQYLYLYSFFNSTSGLPNADVKQDGQINILDITRITSNYGKTVEDPSWKSISRADVNGDLKIDVLDQTIVQANYGKQIRLFPMSNNASVWAYFYNKNGHFLGKFSLDSQGFIRIPTEASQFIAYYGSQAVGVVAEWFNFTKEAVYLTNYAGIVYGNFSLPERGAYVVQVKLPTPSFTATALGNTNHSVNFHVNKFRYVYGVKHPVSLTLAYSPYNVTAGQKLLMIAHAVDGVTGQPAYVNVTFCGDSPWNGQRLPTNGSGIAVYNATAGHKKYDVYVTSEENRVYLQARSETVSVDLRYNTTVVVDLGYSLPRTLQPNEVIQVEVGVINFFQALFVCTSEGGYASLSEAVPSSSISVYVNNVLYHGPIHLSWPVLDVTHFNWTASSTGLYYFRVTYDGSDDTQEQIEYRPSEMWFVANASVHPVRVYFEVSPSKFEPEVPVTLKALAVWADSNETISPDLLHFEFRLDNLTRIGSIVNTTSGFASMNWSYPADEEAHTVAVRVWSGSSLVCMVQPVMLEVCRDTVLKFWANPSNTSEHTFTGKLLRKNSGQPVAGRSVDIYINGSRLRMCSTNSAGNFSINLNIDPAESQIAYMVQAVYGGTDSSTATLNARDFQGGTYTVCVTMFYGFRPSANMTCLVVEPQATRITAPTKTPEQTQQEAQASGCVSVWCELTWDYPFFRTHIQFTMGGARIHVSFNPAIPAVLAGDMIEIENFSSLVIPVSLEIGQSLDALRKLVQELFNAALLDFLAMTVGLLVVLNTRVPGINLIALATYIAGLFYFGNHAVNDLYGAGHKNEGRAYMAGLFVGLVSVFLTTLFTFVDLSATSIIFTSVISAALGALIGHLYDPRPFEDSAIILIAVLLEAIAAAALGLRIPEPIGNLYYCGFLVTTLAAMYACVCMAGSMR